MSSQRRSSTRMTMTFGGRLVSRRPPQAVSRASRAHVAVRRAHKATGHRPRATGTAESRVTSNESRFSPPLNPLHHLGIANLHAERGEFVLPRALPMQVLEGLRQGHVLA